MTLTRELQIKKGQSIAEFLDAVRREFKELRGVSVEQLMFAKSDLIIPHVCSAARMRPNAATDITKAQQRRGTTETKQRQRQ
jgi:ribosomal protein S18